MTVRQRLLFLKVITMRQQRPAHHFGRETAASALPTSLFRCYSMAAVGQFPPRQTSLR